MAWALSLDCSSDTVSLVSDTGIKILREQFIPTVGSDKSETGLTTDAYRCFINSDTVANLRALIQSVNKMTMNARARQERNAGDQVYLNVTEDGSTDVWRSEVLDGDFVPDNINNPNWTNGEAWGTLYLTRRNWFEGPETPIKLYNENSTAGTTGALSIYMNNEATTGAGGIRNCYADIIGTDITGDLPAYGKLVFTTVFASSDIAAAETYYIYSQIGRTASGTAFFSEVSDTGSGDATASGAFLTVTASSGGSVTTTISPAYSSAPSGNYRLIARMDFPTGGTYRVTPFASKRIGTVENLNSSYITKSTTKAGTFPLVPLGVTDIGTFSLAVGPPIVWTASIGFIAYLSGNLTTDFIMHAPADCVRDYAVTLVSPFNFIVDDNTYDDALFAYTSPFGTDRDYQAITTTGSNKIMLTPGINQTMYFTASPWGRDNYITARLTIRPRRSSL